MNFKFVFIYIILVFCALRVNALDVKDFTTKHLGKAEGMHGQRVYSLCQTDDQAIWWSVKGGAERYNGEIIRYYPLDLGKKRSSLSGQVVQLRKFGKNLYAFDNTGKIYLYDEILDQFEQIFNLDGLVSSDIVLNDLYEQNGNIWLTLNSGIYMLRDNKLTSIVKDVHARYIIPVNGQLLFCTTKGVIQVNRQKKGNTVKTISPYFCVSGYYDAQKSKVWLGTFNQGAVVLDVKTLKGDISVSKTIELSLIPHNPIRSICPFDDNTMFIGSDGFGVYTATRDGQDGSLFVDSNEGRQGVLHGNGIYCIMRDSWGNIIIGSYSGGIDILRPVGSTVAIFTHLFNNRQSLANDHVNCVFQGTTGNLLMGTDDGISIFDPKTSTWKHEIRGTVVLSMCKSGNGNGILAGTFGKGVYEVSPDATARQVYSVANGELKEDYVYSVFRANDGTIWMGCLNGQLAAKKASGTKFYDLKYVQRIIQLPNGDIAVGTTYGVFIIDKTTDKIKELDYSRTPDEVVNKYIMDLYVVGGNELWIATEGGGVYIYNLKNRSCKRLTKADGLPSNSVSSFCIDDDNRMWASTDQGIVFIDKNLHITNANYCNGLEREYVNGAVMKLSNGHIIYGSTTGCIIINPKRIRSIDYKVKINLLRLVADNQIEQSDDEKAKYHNMLKKRKVTLDYDQRTFELFYEGIHIRNQHDVVFTYSVGGDKWSSADDQQMIRFINMEPGTHHVILRCVSRACGVVLDEVELTLVIKQPWWNSWWMWCFYILLLIGAFYGAWRVYQLHSKYMRLSFELVRQTSSTATPAETPDMDTSATEEPESATDDDTKETAFVNRATQVIIDNIADSNFTIESLCSEMAMSRTLFYVKLKSLTGKSPQDFIRIIRLERAGELLRSGNSVTDVAQQTGFENPKYFSTVFKKYFGETPSKYKQIKS